MASDKITATWVRRGLLASQLLPGLGFLRRTPGHHRLVGMLLSLGLEFLQHPAQSCPAPYPGTEIAAGGCHPANTTGLLGVFGRIRLRGLGEDLLGDLLRRPVRLLGSVSDHPCAIDSDQPRSQQPLLGAQREDLSEQ